MSTILATATNHAAADDTAAGGQTAHSPPVDSPDPDHDENSSRRQATRVFKKSSSNGKITVYLGKRDFVDHITHVDPIGKRPPLTIVLFTPDIN